MGKNRIEEIVSIEKLTNALDSFSRASGMNLCMLSPLGETIIYPRLDSPFCAKVRKNEVLRKTCLRCASHSALEAARDKKPFFYRCFLGLIDFAVPIYYDGEYIGAICGGQVKCHNNEVVLDYTYDQTDISSDTELRKLFADIPHTPFSRVSELAALLGRLSRYLNHFGILTDIESQKMPDGYDKIRPAIQYINKSYQNEISLKHLSSLCYMSENYFSRLFTKVMNTSVPQYVLELRVKRAKGLLKGTSMLINEIANDVGYDDPAYFIRKFKQATGMTPSEFRRNGTIEEDLVEISNE